VNDKNFERIRERCLHKNKCCECDSYRLCPRCDKTFCDYAGCGTAKDNDLICTECFNWFEENRLDVPKIHIIIDDPMGYFP
jgi:hypothetical protein